MPIDFSDTDLSVIATIRIDERGNNVISPSMQKNLALVPIALTGLRALLAPIIIWMAYQWPYGPAVVVCLTVGFLSDVFDGILARRLGVATTTLRRLDSAADVVFYLAVFWCACVVYPEAMRTYALGFGALLGLEAICHLVSFIRNGQPAATHAYSAKCWGLLLVAASIALLGFGRAGGFMEAMIIAGCLAELEAIAIIFVAPPPAIDIASIFHAWRLSHPAELARE